MTKNSMKKILTDNGVEVYLVTAMSVCGETLVNFVTLDKKLAVEKAFNIYDDYDDYDQPSVYVETGKNNTIIKIGDIVHGEFVEEKFN